MNDQKLAWVAGALLGLLAVVAGAFGAHLLKESLSPEKLNAYETAVRFQFFHALLLLVLGVLADKDSHWTLTWAVRLTLLGCVLFSGSIYLLTLSSLRPGLVTPVGGGLLIMAWALLCYWAARKVP
ncbi:MAG: DUF423 domain-containing protein [Bacteroidetes bacterium]|nr:MAG: DUF423 domain-containing protein [Bacteroidota bacterium]